MYSSSVRLSVKWTVFVIHRLSHVGTNFLKVGNIDILVAYQGELNPKQPNLKSVSESEVSFPVKRPYARKVKKLSKVQTSEIFENIQTLYGLLLPK